MPCGTTWTIHEFGDVTRAVRNLCHQWSCDYCCKRRRRQLVALGIAGNPNTFITLTSNPAWGPNPAWRARRMVAMWRQLVAFLRKDRNTPIEYLAVLEETPSNGEPHLHIQARVKWIDQAWLSDAWAALTGAYIVDIRRIEQAELIARYVAKYTAKRPAKFYGCKRFFRSKRWGKLTKRKPQRIEWWRATRSQITGHVANVLCELLKPGWRCVNSSLDYIEVARGPPPDQVSSTP